MLDRTVPDTFKQKLTELVACLRPDWEPVHIRVALDKAEGRAQSVTPGQFVAVAINAACERSWHTPKGIAFEGRHWPAVEEVGTTVDQGPLCGICLRPERVCRAVEARLDRDERHDFQTESGRAV